MYFYFEILAPFHLSKHFWNYQTMFSKKIWHESTTLRTYSKINCFSTHQFSFIFIRGELRLCLQRIQTHRIGFCCQNFDTVDNSQIKFKHEISTLVFTWRELLIQAIYQNCGSKFLGSETHTQEFRAIHLKIKENIHFNQHPVSSYASQSGYLWCRIFLLPLTATSIKH